MGGEAQFNGYIYGRCRCSKEWVKLSPLELYPKRQCSVTVTVKDHQLTFEVNGKVQGTPKTPGTPRRGARLPHRGGDGRQLRRWFCADRQSPFRKSFYCIKRGWEA